METHKPLTEEEIRQRLERIDEELMWADQVVIGILVREREILQGLAGFQPTSKNDIMDS